MWHLVVYTHVQSLTAIKLLQFVVSRMRRFTFVEQRPCVKSVRIRSFSGPNARKYGPEKLRIQRLFTQWPLHKKVFHSTIVDCSSLWWTLSPMEARCYSTKPIPFPEVWYHCGSENRLANNYIIKELKIPIRESSTNLFYLLQCREGTRITLKGTQ